VRSQKLWGLVFGQTSACFTLSLIVIHQAFVASSVYFLAKVIENIGESERLATYLLLYMGAMVLPFVPGCASFVAMQQWINVVHSRIVADLSSVVRGKSELLRCMDKKDMFESAISRNAYGASAGFIALVHDFCSLLFNSLFSMAVIGWLLPTELLLGYGVSLIAALILVGLFNPRAQRQSSEMEQRYSEYGSILGRAWDNAVVGNAHNFDLWSKEKVAAGGRYYRGMIRLVVFKQGGNLTIAFASMLPTAYLIYTIAAASTTAPAVLAVIVASLTRIFHILNSLGTLVYQMLECSAMKARLSYLFTVRDALAESAPLPVSPIGAVTINGDPVVDFESVIESVRIKPMGRFTIRGANGSGKSTLLVAMKKAYGESAFYIPTSAGELTWRHAHRSQSTGQRMRAVLEEACSSSTQDFRYLLLDEWDANLDKSNREELDAMLTRIGRCFVVVEVRH
jgi:hypothetical protein